MAETGVAQAPRVRASTSHSPVRAVLLATLGILLAGSVAGASTTTSRSGARLSRHRGEPVAAVESGLLPWTLAAPISRAIALP